MLANSFYSMLPILICGLIWRKEKTENSAEQQPFHPITGERSLAALEPRSFQVRYGKYGCWLGRTEAQWINSLALTIHDSMAGGTQKGCYGFPFPTAAVLVVAPWWRKELSNFMLGASLGADNMGQQIWTRNVVRERETVVVMCSNALLLSNMRIQGRRRRVVKLV